MSTSVAMTRAGRKSETAPGRRTNEQGEEEEEQQQQRQRAVGVMGNRRATRKNTFGPTRCQRCSVDAAFSRRQVPPFARCWTHPTEPRERPVISVRLGNSRRFRRFPVVPALSELLQIFANFICLVWLGWVWLFACGRQFKLCASCLIGAFFFDLGNGGIIE